MSRFQETNPETSYTGAPGELDTRCEACILEPYQMINIETVETL